MSNQLMIIRKELGSEKALARMSMAAGFDATNEKGRAKAQACAASVFAEIEKTAGDPKRDLTGCDPHSIIQCAVDSIRMDVPIDGRQMAHLVKYGNKATLQIGYRAYLAKLKEHYPDADFVVEAIYEGDVLNIKHENGQTVYDLKKGGNNVWRDGESGFQGILVAVNYTENGRLIKKANAVPKSRIERARKAAKQDFVWKSDYVEKAKAAAIKATFKHMFAALQGLQDAIRYDNESHYDPNKGIEHKPSSAGSIVDNINSNLKPQAIEHQPEPESQPADEPEAIEGEIVEGDLDENDLARATSDSVGGPQDVFPGDVPDGMTTEEYYEQTYGKAAE